MGIYIRWRYPIQHIDVKQENACNTCWPSRLAINQPLIDKPIISILLFHVLHSTTGKDAYLRFFYRNRIFSLSLSLEGTQNFWTPSQDHFILLCVNRVALSYLSYLRPLCLNSPWVSTINSLSLWYLPCWLRHSIQQPCRILTSVRRESSSPTASSTQSSMRWESLKSVSSEIIGVL